MLKFKLDINEPTPVSLEDIIGGEGSCGRGVAKQGNWSVYSYWYEGTLIYHDHPSYMQYGRVCLWGDEICHKCKEPVPKSLLTFVGVLNKLCYEDPAE